ncbi:VIT1/CCC1 transporter family protein [Egicoccus halophilus]|uniref:Membrane protein n=1 Tax=Egicoccus halophilus TaxID=1670830 RepID=A0A8J3AGR3_9ACTN|nr:VIT1/CCC1 transporter family protein [Egicoccus halophilus]GGI08050.1 membrane protein [Egicoccus halophilus]
MSTSSVPRSPAARDYPLEQIAASIQDERRRVSVLGEVRELVFGAQDGLVSTLAVVAAVVGASSDNRAVLVAGLAAAVAGIFSMAVGEYMGSKSQDEIFDWHLDDERREVVERPAEAEAEVAWLFMEEGMPADDAREVARLVARHPDSLLATMVAKELGLTSALGRETVGSPLRGALVMGGAFAGGALVPVLPFLFAEGEGALVLATLSTGGVLFAIGAVKARWTARSWWASGLEILSLAGFAGILGYLFGTVLPTLLGVGGW